MADTTETRVAPYQRVSDVDVIMTIEKPRPVMGLGNLLILTEIDASKIPSTPASTTGDNKDADAQPKAQSQDFNQVTYDEHGVPNVCTKQTGLLLSKADPKSGAVYKEYSDLDAVSEDYPEGMPVYFKSNFYFAQNYHSDRIAVLAYPKGKLNDALGAFWYNNWTFAVFADSKNSIGDYIQASNIFEANKDHFLVLQFETSEAIDNAKLGGQDYTIATVHALNEAMDSALVGATASLTVGSVTWKFRKLNGITPDDLTVGERKGIDSSHGIAYITVMGEPETSEGWTLSGDYIDNLHGDIWIKSNIQGKIQTLLQQNNKIPYEASGINMLVAAVTEVLATGWEQGIILTDDATKKGSYSVTASPRSAQSIEDISKRHYGGINFTYHRSGAIHTVTVNGTVQSDTITR